MLRTSVVVPILAALLWLPPPARAEEGLREEIERLREKVEALEAQQSTFLERLPEPLHEGLLRIRFPKVPNRRGQEVPIQVSTP